MPSYARLCNAVMYYGIPCSMKLPPYHTMLHCIPNHTSWCCTLCRMTCHNTPNYVTKACEWWTQYVQKRCRQSMPTKHITTARQRTAWQHLAPICCINVLWKYLGNLLSQYNLNVRFQSKMLAYYMHMRCALGAKRINTWYVWHLHIFTQSDTMHES